MYMFHISICRFISYIKVHKSSCSVTESMHAKVPDKATPIGGKVGITHSAGIEPAPPVYRTSMLPLHHEHCTVCGQT